MGFDPSGTGGSSDADHEELASSRSRSDDAPASNGVTSITTGLSDLHWDDATELGTLLEEMPVRQKEEWLRSMFPDVKPLDISYIVKKCDGRLDRATDELLNHSFLDHGLDEGDVSRSKIPRGIDGFLADEKFQPGRKSRSKRKPRTNDSSRASSTASVLIDTSNSRPNVWATLSEDVDFLCTKTDLPLQMVKSAYHASGADLPATLRALVGKRATTFHQLNDLDPIMQLQIVDLKHAMPSLSEAHLYALLSMTDNRPAAAKELAEVMTRSSDRLHPSPVGEIVRDTPLNLTHETRPPTAIGSAPWTKVEIANTKSAAIAHGLAASAAFNQAASAHKRGKCDHLVGGAAAYYSSVGRERMKAARYLSAAAMDAHINAQSSYDQLDLHGASVADAVRITKERVNHWWESLGDARYASGGGGPVRAGYRIVTGVGRHSKDGAPRIGPAVTRMLVREGWKVEVGRGEATVYGKARR